MDITFNSIIVFFSCIAPLTGVWIFLNWAWFTPRRMEKKLKDEGFKGDPYRFSFGSFGGPMFEGVDFKPMNLYDDDISAKILNLNIDVLKNYGKCSYGWFRYTPVLIIREPELLKEIALKNYNFLKLSYNPLAKLLMQGLSTLEREEWSKHRKIIAPSFHIEKVKVMVPEFHTSINDMLTKWEEIVSSKGSSEIDVWPYLQRLTSDIISRSAFGSNYEEGKAIFQLQKEQTQNLGLVLKSVYIPGLRFLPTKINRRMKEISRIVNKKIQHCIVDARMKAMKAGEACRDDFLCLLLKSNSKENDQRGNKDFGLTIEDVIEECKMLYITGQETTSVLLVWTMILLGRHPEWQNRAREEVLQLLGNHQIPDYTALNQLKIVTMILYEVLRLYPPSGVAMKMTVEETKLGNFTLPKGLILLLPTVLVHHEPELWGSDANEFKPERFAGGVSNATKGQFSFFPFGWGSRICPGQNFAMTEAKMTISMILQRFSFEISPSYSHHPYHSPISTTRPMYGAQLIFYKL